MPILTTIKSVSAPRIRKRPGTKPVPIPYEQKKIKQAARQVKQEAIDEAVSEWYSQTLTKAHELAERFNKKPRYFLDIFFQGGARMVRHHTKVNAYNAFKSKKASEVNEGQDKLSLLAIQEEYRDEYEALNDGELEELVRDFQETRESTLKLSRPCPRSRIQDVSNVIRNMQSLISGLVTRVGVDGFFCIVRNNTGFHMTPQWYFTSEALEQYMPVLVRKKWDTSEVGLRIEAFAIGGSDPASLLHTSKQRADHTKSVIRDKIQLMLRDITGNDNAMMQYTNYEEGIVQRYGVILEGWTYDRFVNPSELSTSLGPLQKLLGAIESGACKFVKLTDAQHKERKKQYQQKLLTGEVQIREHKVRSDAGKKRKVRGEGSEPNSRQKRLRSTVTVDHNISDDSD